MIEFKEFAKIPRLARPCVITEKIDGTNGQIYIRPNNDVEPFEYESGDIQDLNSDLILRPGSRNRWIKPGDDNMGFAQWVWDHVKQLVNLGPGHHYGEWWGAGIQRRYGLDHKRFSLFNAGRWHSRHTLGAADAPDGTQFAPLCCHVVPVLYEGIFSTGCAQDAVDKLNEFGSFAAPGFMDPEGIIVYHSVTRQLFKQTCKHDDEPKNAHVKKDPKPPRVKDPSKGGRGVEQAPIDFADRRMAA